MAGPIPWNVIKDYAIEYGLEEDNRKAFYEVIGSMDQVFLLDQHEQAEIERKSKTPPPDKSKKDKKR
jgi:hypothetical protein